MIFIEPGSKAYERMMRELPDLYERSRVMREVMRVRGEEIDRIIFIFDEIFNQFFIETATWHLKEYEEQFGLPVNESDSLSIRRKRVLAKKRSGRANLLSILQAEEPNLTLAWGSNILPFTIKTDSEDYDFGPLLILLGRHAPAHLGYQFRLENPDNPKIGYTIRMDETRFKIYQKLLSGTSFIGRYPVTATIGSNKSGIVTIKSYLATGTSEFEKTAGLISGAKGVQTSFGNAERAFIQVIKTAKTGFSEFPGSGSDSFKQKGTKSEKVIKFSSSTSSGMSKTYACGTRVSGEEVA